MLKSLNNGNKIPQLGLGTWKSKPGEVKTAVYEAIKVGYRHIDCARNYRNEAEVGQGIAQAISEGLVTRDELFITSKLWNFDHAPKDVEESFLFSLEELGLKQIDLYLMHWPFSLKKDATLPISGDDVIDIPISDTWKAMEALVEKGLTKAIGVSNFNIKRIDELLKNCRIKPVMNQVEYHPYLNQRSLKMFCEENGILITGYSPLGSPDRPTDIIGGVGLKPLLNDEKTKTIANKYNSTPAQILIKWQIQIGNIVIPKSVNVDRIKANFESLKIELSKDDLKTLDLMDCNCRYVSGNIYIPKNSHGPIKTKDDLWD